MKAADWGKQMLGQSPAAWSAELLPMLLLGGVMAQGLASPPSAWACSSETVGTGRTRPQPAAMVQRWSAKSTPAKYINKSVPRFVGTTRCPSAVNDAASQFNQGNHAAAIALFSELIEQSPEQATGWMNRALALVYVEDYPAALKDIDQALSLELSQAHQTQALAIRQQILAQL